MSPFYPCGTWQKVRHGYEWWEKFWKWLRKDSLNVFHYLDEDQNEHYLTEWIDERKEEFEKLWREGKIDA